MTIFNIFPILHGLTVDSPGFLDIMDCKIAKELIKFDMYWYLRHRNIQSNGRTHFIAGHFLWQYKSSTGQNVRQIESCAGQNRILTFSAGQMSGVRRYFKAWGGAKLLHLPVNFPTSCTSLCTSFSILMKKVHTVQYIQVCF